MADSPGLGAFLRAHRAALDPAELGLPAGVTRRRVDGLRREELAQLAGISVDYYTRLEQDRGRNVSDSVLDALARALRLTADEHAYLHNLAAPARRRQSPPRRRKVRPELLTLLHSMHDVPAYVFGRALDVLAWNRLGGKLAHDMDAVPPGERNMARLFFLDENTRVLYPDWKRLVAEVAANLRAEAGRYPDDPDIVALVGELSMKSDAFRRLWVRQSVKEKTHGEKRIVNPIVGELTLHYETLRLPDDSDQLLATYTAEPGSASENALRMLASWLADDTAGPRIAE